ncbi:MAG: hypothetical protein ACI379_13590 [Nocardioides sp.]|uniref:hypothetical protein n=1 Tax=Nocardioides sp. TaxID=35761 RepID=UPI003F0FCCF8
MAGADNCRVCGYDWGEPPWGDSQLEPTYWICPCCGVEAGYEDCAPDGARAHRRAWLATGARWADPSTPHDGLEPEQRLRHVPPGYED